MSIQNKVCCLLRNGMFKVYFVCLYVYMFGFIVVVVVVVVVVVLSYKCSLGSFISLLVFNGISVRVGQFKLKSQSQL